MKPSLLIAATLFVAGCTDARQKAVEETLEFAQAAPYTLGTATSRYSGYSLLVADSSLPAYNRLFKYFEPKDTTRASVYASLPTQLLWRLPITKISNVTSRKLSGDTLQVTAIFQRVAYPLLQKLFTEYYSANDTLPPSDDVKKRFRASLARVRQELQESDTAFFWVVNGPKIARFRTAQETKDSIAEEKVAALTRKEFKRIEAEASFTSLQAANYSRLTEDGLDGGGAVNAVIDPGPGGWYTTGGSMEVQCEGRNGSRVTRERGYVLSTLGIHERDKALCLWSGDTAREWNDVQPNSFSMRLLGIVRRDTVFGPWVQIPPSAVRH